MTNTPPDPAQRLATAPPDLVPALRRQLAELEDDLRARVEGSDVVDAQEGVREAWQAEYDAALKAERTADSWQAWRDERVTQAAVAWILLTVFARYCEDNRLVTTVWIAGPDADARQQALDARGAYFRAHPERTDRDWLVEIIEHFARHAATKGLVDEYSPIHQVAPSGDAARGLLEFWWERDDQGDPRWQFTGVDTRFLGDVYQDLSEYAKKKYALLQTPVFVEEFILGQTLTPALKQRADEGTGLEGFTIIDPTCGSGHFLLGAFHTLLERWQSEAPALDPRVLVQKALDCVYGVDVNPFAVAIARFRLIVAALAASGDRSIEKLIDVQLNLAAGDSLLWGARSQALEGILDGTGVATPYSTEDAERLRAILQREHSVVVGNPPYVSVKDRALRDMYRRHYSSCHGKYVLTVPFMELFFDLARSASNGDAGWVGQITSNSFMKREFGVKLIEEFLSTKDLTEVIDTAGAYIPGHGTPTVIMVGRNRHPKTVTVRAALGIRGEPGRPDDPANGVVWSSIVDHIDEPGFEDSWISVEDLDRARLRTHPWSLTGGGAVALVEKIQPPSCVQLETRAESVGITAFTLEDEVFIQPEQAAVRSVDQHFLRPMVAGDEIRDWEELPHEIAIWPYDSKFKIVPNGEIYRTLRFMWPYRSGLAQNKMFGGVTKVQSGLAWYEFGRLTASKLRTPLSITFAEVATHNHFVLDRGGKVFKQTAPVIKLPEGASVDEHLQLLGVLNSSVACFWLKQNCFNKGNGGIGGGIGDEDWEPRYQYNGTTLKDFPLPSSFPLERARTLDALAQQLAEVSPDAVVRNGAPARAALDAAHREHERIRGLMIAHQEELDWECYRLYGLLGEDLTYGAELPGVALGERSFEIALARAVETGEHTAWFERHGSTPTTTIAQHLPADYRALMQRRLDVIVENKNIRLLEKPEHKRRWAIEPWDKRVTAALRDWLLDRVEGKSLWFDADGYAMPRSVAQLADILDRDADFRRVLRMWAGNTEVATGAALEKLLADEAVPYLAALRYKPSGLIKREAWEHTWDLQRREDAGEALDAPIPVPPKYTTADFRKQSYWSHRGKLDLPKERFIAFPSAGRDTDPTPLLGWAGWDHAQQALALAGLVGERIDDGWEADKLVPMLAGLHELAPWVRQWHGEIDPEFGESVADTIDEELRSRCAQLGVTTDDLTTWRLPKETRGRKKKESV
ncbi:BREX-2 system adenine-specific DNA-methyltransferase PglX [Tomitella fengzijianii]|uniref:BREX-2 system adenine-specific DNA-methyltransferase PglX n=1 Tax=Tomitella fengzijianii TaxID=2597660 RepID=UPI001E542CCB|nr:BREX-2 system adenine-specific DNA-methyltransferase PglX [Tomitella fengzijianii]